MGEAEQGEGQADGVALAEDQANAGEGVRDITALSGIRRTMVDVVYHTAPRVFIPLTVGGWCWPEASELPARDGAQHRPHGHEEKDEEPSCGQGGGR
jgi:hypothetical protein